MKYKRYGKFRFYDYISTWLVIIFLLVLVVTAFLINAQFYLLFFPLLLILSMVWSVYRPNSEHFLIYGNNISIMQGRNKRTVSIPNEITLVVSYADICPPFAKHIGCYGNQIYMLKGRYAISILQNIPLKTVFERLHQNYTQKYTNTTVEECFEKHLYVYSFVGDQELLDNLISKYNCQIIIPETLLNKVSVDLRQENIHVDAGY